MARPEKKTVEYFPHYIGDGKKIFYIEQKYGNDGYITWFKLLETLATSENHYFSLNDDLDVLFLTSKCRITKDILFKIIDDLVILKEIDQFLWLNKIVYSHRFVESIQDAYFRRNNKCMSYDGLCIHLIGLCTTITKLVYEKKYINTQTIVYNNKLEETKENNNFDFLIFWNLYPVKKGRAKCEPKWNKLSLEVQNKIMETLPNFIKNKPFESYQHPNPETYFNQKRWEDEIVKTENNTKKEYKLNSPGNKWRGLLTEQELTEKLKSGWWTLEN